MNRTTIFDRPSIGRAAAAALLPKPAYDHRAQNAAPRSQKTR